MASIDVYLGFQWGVDVKTITEGDGLVQPRLLSAVSSDPNTVRATFDMDMMFLEHPGSVLKLENWSIEEQISGNPLQVFYISKVSETEVDLHTANQGGVNYDLVVSNVTNAEATIINPAYDEYTFSGTAEVYPTFSEMYAFFGLDGGMQGERVDVSAPYLDNQNPLPLQTGVPVNTNVQFDLLDREDNIDLTTVDIWIDGTLAYDGATDTFQSGYDGPASLRTALPGFGHRFVIDPTSDFVVFTNIPVHVYAEDAAGFTLDTTYTFRTSDLSGPTIDSNTPTGAGVAKDAPITFSAHDPDSGVNSSTLNVQVDSVNAILAGSFLNGFSGSITPDGFGGIDVIINGPVYWPSYDTVSVAVAVYDYESNIGTLMWTFDVEDHLGCLVTPVTPTNGQTDYPVTGNITLTIEDEDDVLESTIVVEVDPGTGYETAFVYADATQFKPNWDGPASSVSELGGVYTIVIEPTIDFVVGTTVLVRVTADDPSGNPERLP